MNVFDMVSIIREDEGISPLTYREILSLDGETVFVMGDIPNYGTVDVKSNMIKSDSDYDLKRYGIDFYAYRVRPYNVGRIVDCV